MKKFLSILALVLVVAMCASFAVSAAENKTITSVTTGNTATGDITLTYNEAQPDNATVYSVDVKWTDVAFEYNAGTTKWNPTTHQYDISNEDGAWVSGNNTASVKVDNHSNAKVNVAVTYAKATNGLAANVTNGSFELAATAVGGTAATKTATITATEVPTAATAETVGTITVTITAAN